MRTLTKEEKREYDRLVRGAEQMVLVFPNAPVKCDGESEKRAETTRFFVEKRYRP